MRITLCGSTKFKEEFEEWNKRLSTQGHIVYSVSCFGHSGDVLTSQEKETLDHVHKQKIDNSDAIVVLNRNGYIGDSTKSEIKYAEKNAKKIFYLYPHNVDLRILNRQKAQQLCPHNGCRDSLVYGPCALCYE